MGFKITKVLTEDENLVKFGCSWDNQELLGGGPEGLRVAERPEEICEVRWSPAMWSFPGEQENLELNPVPYGMPGWGLGYCPLL